MQVLLHIHTCDEEHAWSPFSDLVLCTSRIKGSALPLHAKMEDQPGAVVLLQMSQVTRHENGYSVHTFLGSCCAVNTTAGSQAASPFSTVRVVAWVDGCMEGPMEWVDHRRG